ncbi:MAG: helicase-related protein [Armatimonadota bacterium]
MLPESNGDMLVVRPLGGAQDETTGIHLLLEKVEPATFDLPDPSDVGDYLSCRLLRDALRLGFRSSAGPFRSFASIAVEPRPYQLVPLLMALKMDPVRLLIADDVGIGKTVEAGLIAKELLDRGEVERLAVLCPPHLAEQWQRELADKFHIQAELVLSSTVKRLERPCRLGESLFDYYPYVVVSTEFIKTDRRRDEFARTCPELVIVDEAHTCSLAGDGRGGRKQRYELISLIAADPKRHMIFVTATPHSGKEEEFRSLLSLLDKDLGNLPEDLSGPQNQVFKRQLAEHFVQRRRVDIRSYLDTNTPFPDREETEENYKLSKAYEVFFHKVIKYARETVTDTSGTKLHQRVRWWSALALLRSIASSPAAAASTLRSRAACADADTESEVEAIGRKTVMDMISDDSSETSDFAPGSNLSVDSDDKLRRQRLLELAREADKLFGKDDQKLIRAIELIKLLVKDGFNPIVFCRFIPTAEYVAEALRKALSNNIEVAAVTGILPPDERENRVSELGEAGQRVLVCTDCLSEGINLQDKFDAVMHYDLAWNPTRHEQREGRVDRYGQPSSSVRVLTYYGVDNHIDGLVLNVLIKKHKAIRSSLGISVPVPAQAEQVMDAIFEGLLLREDWGHQSSLQLVLFDDMASPQRDLNLEWESAAQRERRSRTVFAQETIKVDDVQAEIVAMRDAIGSGVDVQSFVEQSLKLYDAVIGTKGGVTNIDLSQAPVSLRELVGSTGKLKVRFELPVKDNEAYLSRTHPIVEGLASYVMDSALDIHTVGHAKRCGAIRTAAVQTRTTLLLVRFRYHIVTHKEKKQNPLLAEDCRLLAFEGSTENAQWLDDDRVEAIFKAMPDSNIAPDAAREFVGKAINGFDNLLPHLNHVAKDRAEVLLDAHRRVRTASGQKGIKYQVIPNLPPDVLGIYVYLPAAAGGSR